MSESAGDWNPEAYLKFKNERTRPAIDLVNRIDIANPQDIIDIGCGPGNSTAILKERWPSARILGVDNSPAMIEKARANYPDQDWRVADARKPAGGSKYDIVFSNAVIQWIPDHESLLTAWLELLKPGGVLALQMPLYHEMPIAAVVDAAYKDLFPQGTYRNDDIFTYHSSNYYFNLLDGKTKGLNVWETSYLHAMDSHQDIIDMMETTGLKPYLDSIPEIADKARFRNRVLAGLEQAYRKAATNRVIYPFKRMFVVATVK